MADTVLIVDDDEAVLNMLYKVIKSNGIEADTVSSGEAALEILGTKGYDLILLDVNMHGMDGFQVVQSIRKRGLKTPIIIVSGRKEDYDTLYGLDIGADDYVTKPFNPITLGAKVKALIRRSRDHLPGVDTVISAGPFQYNTCTLRFYKNGEEIVLSSKENAMMKLFIDHVNRIFSKDMLSGQAKAGTRAASNPEGSIRHAVEAVFPFECPQRRDKTVKSLLGSHLIGTGTIRGVPEASVRLAIACETVQ